MKKINLCILITLLLALFYGLLQAQEPEINQYPSTAEDITAPVTIDPIDLENFVDGIMAVNIPYKHIAGATFAAVKDGKILFKKGYGLADIEKNKPVTSDKTLFRPGSISKLFTWTAVMQLYEQGKIELDKDINQYIKGFSIPETYAEPITMVHLLSHTPGFEEKSIGMAARKPKDIMALKDFLKKYMPQRIRPPGQITSYSNYGTSLAGYIVECISGIPFEEYIEENIFEPLGMENSSFRQPLPDRLLENMSVGYKYENGVFEPDEFELINGMAPAGGLSITSEDIAKFMIAHLQNGHTNEGEILKEETARLMHTTLFTHDRRLSGNAYGFWEWTYNGLNTIGHGGDTFLFHSYLILVPEQNLGFFVSYNSVGGGGASRVQLIESILDRYFPYSLEMDTETNEKQKKQNLNKFSGTYRSTRVNHSSIEKLGQLVSTIKINAIKGHSLLISSGPNKSQWIQKEPLVFQKIRSQDKLLFREDKKGRITHLFFGDSPTAAFVKLKRNETPVFHFFILGLTLSVFLTTLSWPLGALRRRVCSPLSEKPDAPRLFRLTAGIMSGLCILFSIFLLSILRNPEQLIYGVPFTLKILLTFPFVAIVLAVGVLFFSVAAWIKKYWNRCGRLYYFFIFITFIVFLWFLNYWNLLGFKF